MRLSVTNYRILLLIVNILLGLGVPVFAGYRYWLTTFPSSSGGPFETNFDKFKRRDDGSTPIGPRPAEKLLIVSTWLQPKPPPIAGPDNPTPTPDTKNKGQENGAGEGSELGPGKLGEDGWFYAQYLLREDPLKAFVILRKKDIANPAITAPGTVPGSVRTNPRVRATPKPLPRGTKLGKIAQQATDRVSFRVDERRYINEELGLDFFMDSADENQFVYWLPLPEGGPNKMYALKYKSESQYLANPDDGLVPRPKTPEELEGQPEQKKSNIIPRPSKDWEPMREEEYQNMLKGIGLEPVSAPSDGGLRTLKPATSGAPSATPPPGAQGATPMKLSPSNAAGLTPKGPRAPTAAESKQLKDAINAIPPDAQKQIMEGMQKGGMGAPK